MKRLLLAGLATAMFSASAVAMPETVVQTHQIECGVAKEIKSYLTDLGMQEMLTGTSNLEGARGSTSIMMVAPNGIYTLLLESPDGKYVCIADYGKLEKAGTKM